MDTRKVVLTRFNTGRERGVNTGVSTVEQPLQLSMHARLSFAISAAYALGRPTAGRRLPSIISVSRRSLTSERGRGVSGVRGVWGGGQYIDLLY